MTRPRNFLLLAAMACSIQAAQAADPRPASPHAAVRAAAQSSSGDAGSLPERLAHVRDLMRGGDAQGALTELNALLATRPFPLAYVMRAAIYMDQGDADKAHADFDAALKLDPKNAAAFYGLSNLYENENDQARRIEALNKAIQFAPDEPQFLWDRAQIFDDGRQYANALADLDRLIRLKPNEPNLLMRRCRDRAFEKVSLDAALADCKAALALDPTSAEALEAQALVYIHQGKFADAIADYDTILKTRPNSPFAHFGRGIAELRSHQAQAGEADLSLARTANPNVDSVFAGVLRTPDWYGLTAVEMSPRMR